jgi:hypothetical protein
MDLILMYNNLQSKNMAMYAQQIERSAFQCDQRTGQWLFNHLPAAVAHVVGGTSFDPFHKNMNQEAIFNWLDNHLIFQGSLIIGVFNNEIVLWEDELCTTS